MKHIPMPHRSIVSAVQTSALGASIGLVGGIALQTVTNDLVQLIPLLIALPAINAMAGDYATITTAHIGDPEASRATTRKLLRALIVSVPFSAAGVVGLSVFFAYLQGYEVTRSFVFAYTAFAISAFAVVVVFTFLSSVLLNKLLVQRRVNSDDVLIPVSNVLASVMMLVCVSIAAWQIF